MKNRVIKNRVLGMALGLACAFSLWAAPAMAANDTVKLSLDKVLEHSMANSSSVFEAENGWEKAKLETKKAQLQSDDLFRALGKPNEANMDQNQYAVIRFNPQMQKLAEAVAEESYKLAVSSNKLTTISQYYTIASCGKSENAAVEAYQNAQQQYKAAQSKYKLGMVAKIDVLSAEVQFENAKLALDTARNKTVQEKRKLCALIGFDVNTNIALSSSLSYTKSNISDIKTSALELAEKSPLVAIDRIKFEMAEAQFEYDKRHLSSFTYNGQISQKTYDTAKAQYAATVTDTKANAYKTIEDMLMAEKQYNIAVKSKEITTEVHRLARLRFENGLAVQADVFAAAADVSKADSSIIAALLQYNIAKTSLEHGIISGGGTSGGM